MFSAATGMGAQQLRLDVIANNLANVNTTGFKKSRGDFEDLVYQTVRQAGGELPGGGQMPVGQQVGLGVRPAGISKVFSQGQYVHTENELDVAIEGKGFFKVMSNGIEYYTRAGNFTFDKNGYLVNPDGLQLQGYAIDATGNIGSIADIYIPGERISPPVATTEFNFDINLNSSAVAGDTYTTAQTMYDSLGNAIPVTFTFTRQAAAQTWTLTGSIPSNAGTGVSFDGNASMDVVFDASGLMTSPAADVTVDLALTNGASPLSAAWVMLDASGSSLGDITGYASESGTTFQYQDGYPAGSLRGISVDEAGVVTATYSNGEMTPMFQIALVDFPSYDGLTKMGRNLYAESIASGQALPGVAGTGRLGSVAPSSLEMSNVDLAEEFVKMITTQRAFQANSRVITSSDEILQELINIKR